MIPAFIIALLGTPSPSEITSYLVPQENLVCYVTAQRGHCFAYDDEGTHLRITLNNQED